MQKKITQYFHVVQAVPNEKTCDITVDSKTTPSANAYMQSKYDTFFSPTVGFFHL